MSNAEYLKRYAAPKSWHIARKSTKYITKPNPGAHSMEVGMSLGVVLRLLGQTATARETKKALMLQEVLVDGRRVRDPRFIVGLFDVITIAKEHVVVLLDHLGRLAFRKIAADAAAKKVCRVDGKHPVKGGKLQLNLVDGRNILLEKDDYRVGDSVVLETPSQKIISHIPLTEGAHILLTGGRHVGSVGVVQSVADGVVTYVHGKDVLRTRPANTYAMPKEYHVLMHHE